MTSTLTDKGVDQMKKQDSFGGQADEGAELEGAAGESSAAMSAANLAPASGLYEWPERFRFPVGWHSARSAAESGSAETTALFPWWFRREELRLDVDGYYPQMVASGTLSGVVFSRTHWVADLTPSGPNSWTGSIWYKDGNVALFPYTHVEIKVVRSQHPNQRRATVTFSGGVGSKWVRTFKFKSPYFHQVEFEFDFAEGEQAVTTVDTCAHPNRPASLPCEKLSIQTVYARAGFEVTTSPGGGEVSIGGAGADAKWGDQEMHDAMQTYWSRFAPKAQWAMWVLFASLHEMGTSLGGIMFDDIGANHRQGTAIFNDSFIKNPPAGDPNPEAWVRRMIFWTASHEMGHAFNLAHSWQKALGSGWIPLANEPEARSFMNYPYNVAGGQTAFFADFEYRFSDGELLFMRHAPARFVQMGNADWFDDHGFEEAFVSPEPTLKLDLRVNRDTPLFEFMEPVTLETKLTNVSSQPVLVDDRLLSTTDLMTVVIKKDGKPARQFRPYAQYCWTPEQKVLMPGQSMYEALFVSAGHNGWDLAEPGNYTLQVALQVGGEDIVSNPLRLRVTPPAGYDEEFLAQDFFSDDVGRIVAFNGSRFLTKGNDVLRETTEKLGKRRVALHSSLALGSVAAQDYKQLVEEEPEEPGRQLGIEVEPAQLEEARQLLSAALVDKSTVAIETFGHIEYKRRVDRASDLLAEQGDAEEAVKLQNRLYKTMSAREVGGRKILDQVVEEVKERRDSYKTKA